MHETKINSISKLVDTSKNNPTVFIFLRVIVLSRPKAGITSVSPVKSTENLTTATVVVQGG